MSTARRAALFLVLTFALSWACVAAGAALGALSSQTLGIVTLTAMMFGPAIAAVICTMLFEKGHRLGALGLGFRPNLWWLAAWAFPLLLCVASVLLTVLLSDQTLADPATQAAAAVAAQSGEAEAARLRATPYLSLTLFAAAVTIGPLINAPILTFSEELGWRGYLHHLWRPFGFWRASLATGFVWGIWHAPAIYLFGLNYPENREIGIGLFVVYCMLLSPLMTLIRERGGSTWAAGLAHGTLNAAASLTLLCLSAPAFPWNGIVGIGGFIALALGVAIVALLKPGLARPPALA